MLENARGISRPGCRFKETWGQLAPRTLTPADEEEKAGAQALSGVGPGDGHVQVAALHEHPEEVGDHKVVEDRGDTAAPYLWAGSSQAGSETAV